MQLRKALAPLIAVLSLGACTTVEYRMDQAMTPIEVIDSNFVESTLDAEIVLNATPALRGLSEAVSAA